MAPHPTPPRPLTRRTVAQLLRRAMAGDTHADCASGWKALAELQYENMDYQAAYDTAVRGLGWLHSRWGEWCCGGGHRARPGLAALQVCGVG